MGYFVESREFFEQGFLAYESGDYMKAIHILIPQVESPSEPRYSFLHSPASVFPVEAYI
jgi:hypothetical protein